MAVQAAAVQKKCSKNDLCVCVCVCSTLIEQMELTGRLSPVQAKKKWDNRKSKYKVKSKMTAIFF